MFKQGENTYIMNLEACYIYKDIIENKKLTYKNRDLAKLFSATMPFSLEAIRMDNMFDGIFYEVNGKQYTRKIINITFDKNYSVWDENVVWINKKGEEQEGKRKTLANKNKIRKYLYTNGFKMDGIDYVFYKRGAGKAKNGYALYIQKNMKDKLINRSRLGIEFSEDEELDLTSLLAYESLVASGIDFIINLDPKTEILLIKDIYGKEFNSLASVTREEDGEIKTDNQIVKIQNCLTDGQGLLDESIFEKYQKKDKGMMLLRSDMFKCCGFNTKLNKWFKENEITETEDMYGNKYDTDKIKLVTTPNAIKFLKFAYKFTESKTLDEYNNLSDDEQYIINQKCYNYWRDNIDDLFGVVKCDKEGNYGAYNRLTYQLINSIPNLTYDDLMELTKVEREYVMLLKNDNAVFRNYLGCDAKASLKLEQKMNEGDISLYENVDLMNALLLVNSDIQYTKKFKKMKSDLIANYIGHLREGKIRIKDAKYVTIISNPYEMLLATIGKYNNKSIMIGREVYCQYYNDGQEFCISRNPHINAGNVMSAKNVKHDEYDWFNFTNNIMAVNFFDNDMPDRLQGEDTDSDTNLVVPNEILAEKAKYCEQNFPTPINKVKGSSIPRKNNMIELQKLDVILSNNYIGRIVNMSQIINSYLNDAISKGEPKYVIDELYQASSRLSSMSQIEIDKSKKVFDNISMSEELRKMRHISSIRYVREQDKFGEEVDKMVVPRFFNMISDSNDYRVFEKFNTPLDILQDILVFDNANYNKGEKNIELSDLLIESCSKVDGKYQDKTAKSIYNTITICGKKINGLKLKTCELNDKAKKTIEKKAKQEAIQKIKEKKISVATILSILKFAFDKNKKSKMDFSKYSMLTLNILFSAKKYETLKCFKNNNMDLDEVLFKNDDNYDINIFGNTYKKTTRKSLKMLKK